MESDWEFDVGDGAPVIETHWAGFIDLRLQPMRAGELRETAEFPAMAWALQSINGNASGVWTSKCDFWPTLQPGDFDGDELAASTGRAEHAMACYIDLLPRNETAWDLPVQAEAVCKAWCSSFHLASLLCCRVDLVVRRALGFRYRESFGITAYLTACGATPDDAKECLEAALQVFVSGVKSASTLQ